MKVWIALPNSWSNRARETHAEVRTCATCPTLTREMKEDDIGWYEADIGRKMDAPMQKEWWEEDKRKTLFYQNLPSKEKLDRLYK